MPWLRALLFYIGLAVSTLLAAPILVLLYPLPFRLRYFAVTRWTVFNLWWLGITCNLKYKITGIENIPPGPAIVMSNHQSAWETLALQLIFPAQAWILKRELLWIPIYGWGLAAMQPIAIERGSTLRAFRQIVDQGCQRLAAGIWVVIFPEGTRVAPDTKRKYLPGGGLLAEKSGCPVVPVAHNSGEFWSRNSFIKKPGVIHLVIGTPIESRGKTAEEIMQEVENRIVQAMQQINSANVKETLKKL
jgi:1-acyl-sn-glycerol-3-phosphate acyltransferase